MSDRYQLRHQDYRMNVGTVPAGETVHAVTLQLDTDADFVLRGRAIHLRPPLAGPVDQSQLDNYYDRYTGPDENYFAQNVTRFAAENRNYGQYGQFLPVRTPVLYPRGGVIQADVYNAGDTDMEGVEIYFRGSKIFAPGVLPCATYPARFSPMHFDYMASPYRGTAAYNPGVVQFAAQESRFNLVQNIASDADFVCRFIQVGSWMTATGSVNIAPPPQYFQLYVQFFDATGKYYSNLPVHADTCFGVNEMDLEPGPVRAR